MTFKHLLTNSMFWNSNQQNKNTKKIWSKVMLRGYWLKTYDHGFNNATLIRAMRSKVTDTFLLLVLQAYDLKVVRLNNPDTIWPPSKLLLLLTMTNDSSLLEKSAGHVTILHYCKYSSQLVRKYSIRLSLLSNYCSDFLKLLIPTFLTFIRTFLTFFGLFF